MLRKVETMIEKMQSNFLWRGTGLKRKLHMVSWNNATKNEESGGLGIRQVREMNDSILIKWWWRFGKELLDSM